MHESRGEALYAGNTRAADTTEQQRQKPSCNAASRLRGAAHAPVSPLLAAPVRHSCHNNNQRPPASPPCRHHVRRCRRPVPRGDVHSWRPHTRACCAQIRAQGRLVHRPRVIRLTLAWCPCAARRAWPCADTGAARGCPKFRLLRRPARPGAPCLSSAKGTQLRSTLPPPPGARPVSDGGNTARLRPRTPACVGTCVPRRLHSCGACQVPLSSLTPSVSQCGTTRGSGDLYFCGSCHVIMPADPGHDYFALLGAPRHFDVSQPALELAFKEAQKLLHPDKVSMRQEVRAARDCGTGGGTNSDSVLSSCTGRAAAQRRPGVTAEHCVCGVEVAIESGALSGA